VSVVEYNLINEKKPVPVQQAAGGHSCADKKHKTHERDIFRRIRTRDVCRIARQLATLLRAGMPLVPALSALVEQSRGIRAQDNPLAEVLEQVAKDVNSGSTLANALSKHPKVFSNLFTNMVAAGETSGTLEEILLRLAEILEKRVNLAAKVKSAIAYPLMMVPWPTRLLITTSAFMKTYWMLIAVMVCLVLFGSVAAYKTKKGRLYADRTKLKLPLFGSLFLKLEIARLSRTLGILLVSGIPILSALEIAKQVIQNRVIADGLDSVKDMVSKGDAIANAMRKTGLFPPIVHHIITTGQVSGNLEEGLINIADMYEDEVELTTKTLTSLLEPVILLFMGAVVGFIVLAILLPIFDINQVL